MKSRSSGAIFLWLWAGWRLNLIVSFSFAFMFEDVFALKPKMFKPVWKVAREPTDTHHDVQERVVGSDWRLSASWNIYIHRSLQNGRGGPVGGII